MQTLENGSLSIKELAASDGGVYQCEAGNAVGLELSKRVTLRVLVRAHFKSSFELQRVQRGRPLQLLCRAYGERPLRLRWLRERLELEPDKRYETQMEETEDGLVGRLRVASTERAESSTFSCLASNAYGQAELAHRVLVEEPPDPPQRIELADFAHDSATIRFAVPYAGNSPIRKYLCEWKPTTFMNWTGASSVQFDGTAQQVTIGQLQPLSSYDLRLFAINQLGRSEASQIVTITTDEQGL